MSGDAVQLAALALAGVVLPFVQERLAGAHVTGPAALWVDFAVCFLVAVMATFLSGSLTFPSFADPATALTFYGGKAAGVFVIAQAVYQQFVAPKAAPTPPAA